LRREEMLELAERAPRIDVRESDRDERAIPAPRMRVEARGRLGPAADMVAREDTEGRVA
jgi:hypothetical protein